jgi:hypothetical protein
MSIAALEEWHEAKLCSTCSSVFEPYRTGENPPQEVLITLPFVFEFGRDCVVCMRLMRDLNVFAQERIDLQQISYDQLYVSFTWILTTPEEGLPEENNSWDIRLFESHEGEDDFLMSLAKLYPTQACVRHASTK